MTDHLDSIQNSVFIDGNALRAAREAAGFTVKELGRIMGRQPLAVYNWEAGRSAPNVFLLAALSRILDVDINRFIGYTDPHEQYQRPVPGRAYLGA